MRNITVSVDCGLRIIILDRPEKKNALDQEMYHDLILALKEAASDEKTFITVITGRGDYYSSGNDITSGADFVSGDLKERINEACILIRNFVNAFIEFPKILVAAVNGPAIGIGVTTLGLCDVVYASDKAGDLLYFNYKMTAKEAKDCGLVSEVFPDSCFAEKVFGHLKKMVTMPSKSMIFTKALVRRWDVDELRKANEAECERLKERWGSEDFINAVVKFISRRNKL
ncbi:enoyl-CoA delta isomerase 2-like isoform X3 [Hetaerina americana]|uniref:enoyl-CoA delta isomerase 2-like isoform X3 n=1 Tax=Hetaerina americana TaxID=62018 RepID=UPI003A7F5D93